ncbi:MAG: hypothetical protein PF517_19135 [Salinivirgaceae bacterium]|nr:hypothetical protein [Salinivirgaceae bacterium]
MGDGTFVLYLLPQTNCITNTCTDFKMTVFELNSFLWDKYHSSNIWYVISAIGLFSALSLFFI